MYNYDGSPVRQERLANGTDHCGSAGDVYNLHTLVSGDVIVEPDARERPLATGSSPGAERVLIYAVDSNFNMHIGFDGVRDQPNAVKHETLFHNADVFAAGELTVNDGIIVRVNDRSGSYRTVGKIDIDRRFAEAVLTAIDRASAPLSGSERSRLREKAGRK
jgi:hypothetical protein